MNDDDGRDVPADLEMQQPGPYGGSRDGAPVDPESLLGSSWVIRLADHLFSRRQVSIFSSTHAGVALGL